MGRIRVLSDAVANKIAAGEVVERPASVVKELLENSLDAGASALRVDIESGGKRLIRIADDGCGMLRDDAMLAFERHATSKLADVRDLEHIATLGFRGEALPSIASVSRLVLETRSEDESTGCVVEIAGGKLLRCDEAARTRGTTITVRDLFFNVPARKKFLRTEQTELAHIASLVTHYSLAHPAKTFELRNGAAQLLSVTPVETLRERVYQVFGGQLLEDVVPLGEREKELPLDPGAGEEGEVSRVFLLRGFVSRPQVQKLNRNSIFLFVNGRLIKDRLLLHALSSAYHNLMPPSCYPFALLFLDCDAGEVDVNVHPSKTEVRFRHATFVHDFVRDSVRQTLMETRPAASFPTPGAHSSSSGQPAPNVAYSEFTERVERGPFFEPPLEGDRGAGEKIPPDFTPGAPRAAAAESEPSEALPELRLQAPAGPPRRFDFSDAPPLPMGLQQEVPLRLPIPDTHGGWPAGVDSEAAQDLGPLSELRPLGQLHDSFIIAAGRDGLWIVDQHVAHERVLFEKVLKQQAAGQVEMQQLLMPILLELTPGQQVEYARIADELRVSGFDSEPFGNRTMAIKAAPAGIASGDIEKAMFEILETGERELRRVSLDSVRRAIAASVACRAAIKINTRLDVGKMEWLLKALAGTECPMSCPHGRPVALRYGTREILRSFHRI